jgi:hypothetical protein
MNPVYNRILKSEFGVYDKDYPKSSFDEINALINHIIVNYVDSIGDLKTCLFFIN